MRPTPRPPILALILALLAAHAWSSAPARADIMTAPLPADAAIVQLPDLGPLTGDADGYAHFVGVVPGGPSIAFTVDVSAFESVFTRSADDSIKVRSGDGPQRSLTLTVAGPGLTGVAFAFGSVGQLDSVAINGGGPIWVADGSLSFVATGADRIHSLHLDVGIFAGIVGIRVETRPTSVPEPAGWLPMTLGGLMVGLVGWRAERRR